MSVFLFVLFLDMDFDVVWALCLTLDYTPTRG